MIGHWILSFFFCLSEKRLDREGFQGQVWKSLVCSCSLKGSLRVRLKNGKGVTLVTRNPSSITFSGGDATGKELKGSSAACSTDYVRHYENCWSVPQDGTSFHLTSQRYHLVQTVSWVFGLVCFWLLIEILWKFFCLFCSCWALCSVHVSRPLTSPHLNATIKTATDESVCGYYRYKYQIHIHVLCLYTSTNTWWWWRGAGCGYMATMVTPSEPCPSNAHNRLIFFFILMMLVFIVMMAIAGDNAYNDAKDDKHPQETN